MHYVNVKETIFFIIFSISNIVVISRLAIKVHESYFQNVNIIIKNRIESLITWKRNIHIIT